MAIMLTPIPLSAQGFIATTRTALAGLRVFVALGIVLAATHAQAECANGGTDPTILGVARVVEIDTSSGAVLGKFTKLPHEASFLGPDEVVLSFDDGPMPWITRSILATLERHCTRATFFSVGKMALAYPNVLREVLDQGHTVGTHTWSHPLNLKRLPPEAARSEIERGFAATAVAAGRPIAPFFRFPGLSDSPAMVAYLAERHVASFTVDVVSNDSFIHDPQRLTRETLAKVDANHGGIILFHDIKATTAKALPAILDGLAQRGYSVVHMVPKEAMRPQADLMAGFTPQVAKLLADQGRTKPMMVPFFGTVGPVRTAAPGNAQSIATRSLPSAAAEVPVETLRGTDALREDTMLDETTQPTRGRWSTRIRRFAPN